MNLSGLEALRDGLMGACADAVADVCESVRADSAALCPVQSGALRQSLVCQVQSDETEATGTVMTTVPYAGSVELGTYKQAAKPFLHPAFLARANGLADAIGARLSGLV